MPVVIIDTHEGAHLHQLSRRARTRRELSERPASAPIPPPTPNRPPNS